MWVEASDAPHTQSFLGRAPTLAATPAGFGTPRSRQGHRALHFKALGQAQCGGELGDFSGQSSMPLFEELRWYRVGLGLG